MKKVLFCFLVILIQIDLLSQVNPDEKKILFDSFITFYQKGDLVNSEKTLNKLLEFGESLSNEQLIAVYNNLGVIYLDLGKFDDALNSNLKSVNLLSNSSSSLILADLYNNIGRLYNIKKRYDSAIEYLEKSIRTFKSIGGENKTVLEHLCYANINISISFSKLNNYETALKRLYENVQIQSANHLPGLSFTYFNIAKLFDIESKTQKAYEYYLLSINSFNSEYNSKYYRLAEVYNYFGILLRNQNRIEDALASHKHALTISLVNYGEKHTIVSQCYENLGDDYMAVSKIDSALYFYQRSLVSVVKGFNNLDIRSNPSLDSSLFDLRLLDNLKSKARALNMLKTNDRKQEIEYLKTAKNCLDLALNLIDRIRNDYMSEESRIYLSENEKETYIFAVEIASKLYSLTNEPDSEKKIYSIAQRAKAAILRNDLTGNELLNSSFVPDSLREKRRSVISNIAAYNNLITEEEKKASPDSARISLWKDAVFDMNRDKEKINNSISLIFPQYNDLLKKTQPSPVEDIQRRLKKDETILDYLLSNSYKDGKRHLFIFLISQNDLKIIDNFVDSTFADNATVLRNTTDPAAPAGKTAGFITYTSALSYMYNSLIKPVENGLNGTILEIIPDEEIAWLPFDAFLRTAPQDGKTDYEGLDYLVRHYTFSYGYSSSLVATNSSWSLLNSTVCSFSPDYDNVSSDLSSLTALKRSGEEINSIYRYFRGRRFQGSEATKSAFLGAVKRPAIFHLAMHSLSDTADSRYSYLLFEHQQTAENERLYNYEISLTSIKSPMVVLSACNSGSGTLYSGEGLMSLARGFILAGASSVIKTAWDINDETSSSVMTRFYYHLGRGDMKNVAMRKAKLDYLRSTSPATAAPFYWAAYEVQGDNSPVARNRVPVTVYSLLIIVSVVLLYLRRRNIL